MLVFTKTNSGGTATVWFYDMQADGYSLDDKRTPLGNAERGTRNGERGTGNGDRWSEIRGQKTEDSCLSQRS